MGMDDGADKMEDDPHSCCCGCAVWLNSVSNRRSEEREKPKEINNK